MTLPLRIHPAGPCPAGIMLVGDYPTAKDLEKNEAYSGTGGWLLSQLLSEAGLAIDFCFRTYVVPDLPALNDEGRPDPEAAGWIARLVRERTPEHSFVGGKWIGPVLREAKRYLEHMILEVRPTVVVALGDIALLTLAGKWGMKNWRSSIIQGEIEGFKFKIIPTWSPDSVFREWPLRPIAIHDFRRVEAELQKGPVVTVPRYAIITRPRIDQVVETLNDLLCRLDESGDPYPLASDIETRAGHIACLGIAWSKTEAICIPFMCVERPEGYWTPDEELAIISLLRRVLTHPKAAVFGQNWVYDRQYIHRWFLFIANMGLDTMVTHHAMFSSSQKGLGYLSSIYCEHHEYWKDDGRLWDPSMPEDDFWFYNGEDCVRTYEVADGELQAITALHKDGWEKLPSVVDFQTRLQTPVLKMMLRGVRSDDRSRAELAKVLLSRIGEIQREVEDISGQPLNPKSPKQMQEYFYDILGFTPIRKRQPGGKYTITCDSDALQTLAGREPIIRPLVARIEALRSAGVFLSTFVNMGRDWDGRLRCSYNTAGTVTYRFSSSENVFGSGGNLQNVPSGDEDEDNLISLPNIRKLFLFDHGKTGFDMDGDSADLRIVTGESGCRQMQAYFAAGAKPYVEIAKEYYRDQSITKHDKRYKRMKALCHGTNYGGEDKGLAMRVGLGVHDVSRVQKWYFGMCPEIKAWQEDIINSFESRGWIENPFGYRAHNFERWSRKIANEGLAWVPQSSVGILINHCLVAIDDALPDVELLLQVHDSLTGQFPTLLGGEAERRILEVSRIPIQCRHELVTVPMGLKTSRASWGECA